MCPVLLRLYLRLFVTYFRVCLRLTFTTDGFIFFAELAIARGLWAELCELDMACVEPAVILPDFSSVRPSLRPSPSPFPSLPLSLAPPLPPIPSPVPSLPCLDNSLPACVRANFRAGKAETRNLLIGRLPNCVVYV